jgi:ABC-type multidrug transport system permease subunit
MQIQKSVFDRRFDKSKSLSDFLPSYKSRSDCYQDYLDYVTKRFAGAGDICECCNQKTLQSNTFKASWRFEYLDTTSSLLALILTSFAGAMFVSVFIKMNKLYFSTLHVTCPSCSTRIKLWRLLSKTLQGILTTLMIVSLILVIFTLMAMFAQPQMMSIYLVGIILVMCALVIGCAVLVHKSEKIGLLGDLSKIAKKPIILESIKFHKAHHN